MPIPLECARLSAANAPDQPREKAKPQSLKREIQRVAHEAKSLAVDQRIVTKNELLARAIETASPHQSIARVKKAVETVLKSPHRVGLQAKTNEQDNKVYVSLPSEKEWRKFVGEIDYVFRPSGGQGTRISGKLESVDQKFRSDARRSKSAMTQRDKAAERSTDLRPLVENILRSHQFIGAVGRVGVKAATIAVELYQEWAKPIWRVHGKGNERQPGSVAAMVRDLKPRSLVEAHKEAIRAMWKLNGTFDQKLGYGEQVFRQSRQPKYRIPGECLIVVTKSEAASNADMNFLKRQAERVKAKIMLVDADHSRSQLMQAAKTMKPGEIRHFSRQEMDR